MHLPSLLGIKSGWCVGNESSVEVIDLQRRSAWLCLLSLGHALLCVAVIYVLAILKLALVWGTYYPLVRSEL
jgi:hypothetical protein